MCFTDKPTKSGVTNPKRSMQIYSVKVEEIYGDLHWPVDLFGIVTGRDDLDHAASACGWPILMLLFVAGPRVFVLLVNMLTCRACAAASK
jgi:hypothetical protein